MTDESVPKDHSVTCALCDELADERETVSLWEEDYDNPRMKNRVVVLPDGEAHLSCFDEQAPSYPAGGDWPDVEDLVDEIDPGPDVSRGVRRDTLIDAAVDAQEAHALLDQTQLTIDHLLDGDVVFPQSMADDLRIIQYDFQEFAEYVEEVREALVERRDEKFSPV